MSLYLPYERRSTPRRRRSLPCIPTPLRVLERRYTSSHGGEGSGSSGGRGGGNSSSGGGGLCAWWPSSSGGATVESSSSLIGSRQSCGFRNFPMDEAFFESYGVLEEGGGQAGVRLAARKVAAGVRVLCTIGRAVNSCTLSIIGDDDQDQDQPLDESRGVFIRLMGVHSTLDGYLLVPLADIAGVTCEPRGPRDVITCNIRKQRGGGSKVLSVVCLDPHGAPSASLTKAVSLVLAWNANVAMETKGGARDIACAVEPEDVWQDFGAVSSSNSSSSSSSRHAVANNDLAGGNIQLAGRSGDEGNISSRININGNRSEIGRYGGRFSCILKPAGLLMEYEDNFEQSGLDFEDLASVGRKDLEMIVGITDRLHQIKIMTQIRLRFHGAGSQWAGGEGGGMSDSSSSGSSSLGRTVHYTTSVVEGTESSRPWYGLLEEGSDSTVV